MISKKSSSTLSKPESGPEKEIADKRIIKIAPNSGPKCQDHTNRSADIFCRKCGRLICSSCIRNLHNGHESLDIDQMSSLIKDSSDCVKLAAKKQEDYLKNIEERIAKVSEKQTGKKDTVSAIAKVISYQLEELQRKEAQEQEKKVGASQDKIARLNSIVSEHQEKAKAITQSCNAKLEESNKLAEVGGAESVITMIKTHNDLIMDELNLNMDKLQREAEDLLAQFESAPKEEATAKVEELKEDQIRSSVTACFNKIHGKGFEDVTLNTAECLAQLRQFSSVLQIYDPDTGAIELKNLQHPAFTAIYGCAIAVYQGQIFLSGGSPNLVDHLRTTFEYSQLKDKLLEGPNMNYERSEHAMTVAGNSIFCLGGRNDSGQLCPCERCPLKPEHSSSEDIKAEASIALQTKPAFRLIAALNTLRSFPSVCSFCTGCDDCVLFAFGGLNGENVEATVEMLGSINNEKESWIVVGRLPKEFVRYNMGVIQARLQEGEEGILIVGGAKERDSKKKSQETYFWGIGSDLALDTKKKLPAERLKIELPVRKVEGMILTEGEDFYNRAPMLLRNSEIWLMGQTKTWRYPLPQKKASPVSPQWTVVSNKS